MLEINVLFTVKSLPTIFLEIHESTLKNERQNGYVRSTNEFPIRKREWRSWFWNKCEINDRLFKFV